MIHVADVHVPFLRQHLDAPVAEERYEHFVCAVDGLVEAVRSAPEDQKASTVAVVVGDVLDCRHTANAATVALVHRLIEGLARSVPVYVTAGNHDLLLDHDGREGQEDDLLGVLLAPLASRLPVAYLDATGVYGTPGSGAVFGLLHIRDAMEPGNCSGDTRGAADIPYHVLCDGGGEEGDDTRVLLFHGRVSGYRLTPSVGGGGDGHHHPQAAATAAVPNVTTAAKRCGYHLCMLGDVHTMQVHNCLHVRPPAAAPPSRAATVCAGEFEYPRSGRDKDIPWAYSGSLTQLNAGERVFPHGFLEWDLPARRVRAFHVPTPFGVLFASAPPLRFHNLTTPVAEAGASEPLGIAEVQEISWFPSRVALRSVGGADPRHIAEEMHRVMPRVTVHKTSRSAPSTATTVPREGPTASASAPEPSSSTVVDLSVFGRADAWVDFARDDVRGTSDESRLASWSEWLHTPEKLRVPLLPSCGDLLPASLTAKVHERNAKIAKKCADLAERRGAVDRGSARHHFSVDKLRWSWLLCYGPDNHFDFTQAHRRVALLAAPNGYGKSSMLEILCIALYGQPMASRGGKASLADALNRRGGKSGTCSVDVTIPSSAVGEEESFRVSRTFSVGPGGKKLASTARVSKIVPPGRVTLITVKDGPSAVNAWVAANLGTLQGFLLCALLSQNSDADFFAMRPAEQKGLLDDALALDVTRTVSEILKEARLAHGAVLDALDTAMESQERTARQAVDREVPRDGDGDDDVMDRVVDEMRRRREETSAAVSRVRVDVAEKRTLVDALRQRVVSLDPNEGVAAGEGDGEEPPFSYDDDREAARSYLGRVTAWSAATDDDAAWKEHVERAMATGDRTVEEVLEEMRVPLEKERDEATRAESRSVATVRPPSEEDVSPSMIRDKAQRLADLIAEHGEGAEEDGGGGSSRDDVERLLCAAKDAVADKKRAKAVLREAEERREHVVRDLGITRCEEGEAKEEHRPERFYGLEDAERTWSAARRWRERRDELCLSFPAAGFLLSSGGTKKRRRDEAARALVSTAREYLFVRASARKTRRQLEEALEAEEAGAGERGGGPYEDSCWACNARREAYAAAAPKTSGGADFARERLAEAAEEVERLRDALGLSSSSEGEAVERLVSATETWLSEWLSLPRSGRTTHEEEEEAEWHRREMSAAQWMSREAEDAVRAATYALETASVRATASRAAFEAAEAEAEEREVREEIRTLKRVLEAERDRERHAELRDVATRASERCRDFCAFRDRATARFSSPSYEEDDAVGRKAVGRMERWVAWATRRVRSLEFEIAALCTSEARSQEENDAALVTLSRASVARDAYAEWRSTRACWKNVRDEWDARKRAVERLAAVMDGFTAWVYRQRALPAIEAEVDALLATMNLGSVPFRGHIAQEDGGELGWTLGGAPISKCSGMQRFVVSLAVRVALCQLGACSVRCAQLVIDEGFAALDARNIASVPEFLHEAILDAGRYVSVLLVSHLEGVRDAADVVARITTSPSLSDDSVDTTHSCLRFGEAF